MVQTNTRFNKRTPVIFNNSETQRYLQFYMIRDDIPIILEAWRYNMKVTK